MKKSKLFVAGLGLLLGLTGCNKKLGIIDNNAYLTTYDKVHIISSSECFEINGWRSFDNGGIEVIKGNNVWRFASTNVILVKGFCPICQKYALY